MAKQALYQLMCEYCDVDKIIQIDLRLSNVIIINCDSEVTFLTNFTDAVYYCNNYLP